VFTFVVYISSELNFLGKIKNPPPDGSDEGAGLNGLRLSKLKNTYIGTTQSGAPSEGTAQSGEPTNNFKTLKTLSHFSILYCIPYYSILLKLVKWIKN
jgi:hypothetical protein